MDEKFDIDGDSSDHLHPRQERCLVAPITRYGRRKGEMMVLVRQGEHNIEPIHLSLPQPQLLHDYIC